MCADGDGANDAVLFDFLIGEANDWFRYCEAEAFAASAGRVDEGVDADQIAITVDERAAAVARVNRGIRLNVNHWLVDVGLPSYRTHDAFCHRVIQALR